VRVLLLVGGFFRASNRAGISCDFTQITLAFHKGSDRTLDEILWPFSGFLARVREVECSV
jgi:hypothetical protein